MMSKFQTTSTRLGLLMVGLAIVIAPIAAVAKNAAHKATGSAAGTSSNGHAEFAMDLTEGLSATVEASDLQNNSFTYSNEYGLAYGVDVRFSVFDNNAVWFAGPMQNASNASLNGQWMVVKVQDNGQGNSQADTVSMRTVSAPSIAYNMVVNKNQYLFDNYEVDNGNLTVR
jgi:hypothetical protein